eukprot:1136787-Pelagomonas_calceolata.AAC.3
MPCIHGQFECAEKKRMTTHAEESNCNEWSDAAAADMPARLLVLSVFLDALCHDGLNFQCFSTGAFLWEATAAGAICPGCMGQAHLQSVASQEERVFNTPWPSDHLE